jgi:hypothetical protein
MIRSFVKIQMPRLDLNDPNAWESLEDVKEKLNYYRQLSKAGLQNLTSRQYLDLTEDLKYFLSASVGVPLSLKRENFRYIYRVTVNKRITNNNNDPLTKISNLLGPPAIFSPTGRCSIQPEDLSIFYCTLDFLAAVLEIRPNVGDKITISVWRINENQSLTTHMALHPKLVNNDFFTEYYKITKGRKHPVVAEIIDEILFFFTEEFLKKSDDQYPENYLFSSYFSFVTHSSPKENNFKLDTVLYPSNKVFGATNLAILNSVVLDKLELQAVYRTTIDTIDREYNDVNSIVLTRFEKYDQFDLRNDEIIDDGLNHSVQNDDYMLHFSK